MYNNPLDPRILAAVQGTPQQEPFRSRIAQKHIFPGESGGDYDALYGFSHRQGGRFAGTKLTDMTVGQVLDFTNPNGDYGQWVKGQNKGVVSTPTGAYQVVGSTLSDAVKALGIDPNQKYDQATQDAIGEWIYNTQGPDAWKGWNANPSLGDNRNGQPESYAMLGGMGQQTPALAGLSTRNGPLYSTNVEEPEPEPTTLLGKLNKWTKGGNDKGSNSEKLLAIGSGLLSGNDWASGIGAAGQNLQGVMSNTRDEQYRRDNMQMDEAYRREKMYADEAYRQQVLAQADQPRDDAYMQQAGLFVNRETGAEAMGVFDPNSGRVMSTDGQVLDSAWVPSVRSATTIGTMNAQQFGKRADEVTQLGNSLGAVDRVLTALDTAKFGPDALATDLSRVWKTLTQEKNLSPEEIQQMATRGELQGLIGNMRLSIVGPGVMTEQDAERIIAAIGGDMNSYLQHPDVLKNRLTTLRESQQRGYDVAYGNLKSAQEASPNAGYVIPQYYETPKIEAPSVLPENEEINYEELDKLYGIN